MRMPSANGQRGGAEVQRHNPPSGRPTSQHLTQKGKEVGQ